KAHRTPESGVRDHPPPARVRNPPVPAANHIPAKVYSSNSLACPTSVSAKEVSPNHTIFLRHSLLERQLFLRSRLELRRAVHSEDHVKEFLTHYTRKGSQHAQRHYFLARDAEKLRRSADDLQGLRQCQRILPHVAARGAGERARGEARGVAAGRLELGRRHTAR